MSFCSNCGMELTEGTAFCPNCGAGQVRPIDAPEQVAPVAEPEVVNAQPVYQEADVVDVQPVYQQPVYQAPVQNVEGSDGSLTGIAKVFSIISLASGIASILLCCSGPTFGIAAIVFSILSCNKTPEGVSNAMAKIGLITGIIGTVLGVIMLIVSFVSGFINGYNGVYESFQYM